MRTTKTSNASKETVESAKSTALKLMNGSASINASKLFNTDDLEYIENGIKKLNDYSNKSWLLSSILLYTLIYNKGLYQQSGLSWEEYAKSSRERLGMDQRDITEQLSAARFFISYHKELQDAGFSPVGNNRKLARAELAFDLCGNVQDVISHLINDTWNEFNIWYSSFKKKDLPEIKRSDINIVNNRFYIGGVEAVKVSNKLPEKDKEKLEKYITQIFEALRMGNDPVIK